MAYTPDFSRFTVVLANPDSSYNIGAVCRAMKTMGFERLVIAGRVLHDEPEKVRFMSVHAFDIYEHAARFPTLEDALRSTSLSAGFTRRHGKRRKMSSFLPEEFAHKALVENVGEIALVFGNEEHGLTTEELELCSCAVHIPTAPDFPSLNLSHAVQIGAYTMYRAAELLEYGGAAEEAEDQPAARERPIDMRRLGALVDAMVETLDEIGLFRISPSEPTRSFLRDIMARASLSPRESEMMANIFRKIRHIK